MTPETTLPVIAQIAATFAGFTALVSIVDRSQGGKWARISIWRILRMLQVSLTLVVMCLLPTTLSSLGLEARTAWTLALWLNSALGIYATVMAIRSIRTLSSESEIQLNQSIRWINTLLSPGIVIFQFAVLTGLLHLPLDGTYLLAMIANLLVAALIFFALVQQLDLQRLESEEKTGEDEPG